MSEQQTGRIEFPCIFPLKAIGRDQDNFREFITEIVRRHVPELKDDAVSTRASSGGKYISVTATFIATSQEQLDAMYHELSSHERVLFVL